MAPPSQPRLLRVFVRDAATARAGEGTGEPPRRLARANGADAAVSVSDAIDTFLAAVDDRSARDRRGRPYDRRTARDLRWCLAGHVREALGAKPVDAVRRCHVEALVAELADDGVSQRRCRAVAAGLRALYDDAVVRGLAHRNPASGVGPEGDAAAPPAVGPGSERAISLVLRGATVGFLLLALVFLTESL